MIKKWLLVFTTYTVLAERMLVDEIVAVIYHPEGASIITRSDVRPGLDGALKNLRQIVVEELIRLEAIRLKIPIGDDEVDRYLMQIQKQNGLSLLAIESLFKQLGFTLEQGKEQIRNNLLISQVISYKVSSNKRMMVNEQDICTYYEKHPQYTPMTFTLRQAFVDFEGTAQEKIDEMIKNSELGSFGWEEQFTIEDSELAEDKQFLKTAAIGSIVEQNADEEGVELTQLVARTDSQLRTFEDRKSEIEMELRKQRHFEVLREYENELLSQANIKFTHEADRQEVLKN